VKNPPKRPRDPNQLAKMMLDIVTGEVPDPVSEKKKNPSKRRIGGLAGGKARAESLSPQKRKEIAKKAARTRWNKESKKKL
jgi:hypothetical protein